MLDTELVEALTSTCLDHITALKDELSKFDTLLKFRKINLLKDLQDWVYVYVYVYAYVLRLCLRLFMCMRLFRVTPGSRWALQEQAEKWTDMLMDNKDLLKQVTGFLR